MHAILKIVRARRTQPIPNSLEARVSAARDSRCLRLEGVRRPSDRREQPQILARRSRAIRHDGTNLLQIRDSRPIRGMNRLAKIPARRPPRAPRESIPATSGATRPSRSFAFPQIARSPLQKRKSIIASHATAPSEDQPEQHFGAQRVTRDAVKEPLEEAKQPLVHPFAEEFPRGRRMDGFELAAAKDFIELQTRVRRVRCGLPLVTLHLLQQIRNPRLGFPGGLIAV